MQLNHITFRVRALEESMDFYQGLLGLKVNINLEEVPTRLLYMEQREARSRSSC